MSLPGKYDFELYEGDSNRKAFQFLEENKAPVNLTGSVIVITAKRRLSDTTPALTLEASFDNVATGDFHFVILPRHTKSLGTSGKPLSLFYDMQYSHGDTVITISYGVLTILPEVTK